jgi:hypothetical protein
MDFEETLIAEAKKKKEERFPAIPEDAPSGTSILGARQFDTRAVMADLKVLEAKSTTLIAETNALEIATADEKTDAANISGDLQELTKKVKKKCEDFLEPYKKVASAINGAKKRIIDAATQAKTIVNQKIFQYKKQEEINQAKQQKIINEQAASLQKKLNVQAKELKIEAPTVAPIKAPKPVAIVRGSTGASVYGRKGWKCEIIDPGLVMREYCLPSQTLLNQAVKMGVRKTPGCRIYEDETPVTRSG